MTRLYSDPARALQDRFDTRRLADRIEERLLADTIGDGDRALIECLDMFFLATVDAEGQPQCAYQGGEPGFVRVLDERTLAFPLYYGNGMFLSAGNVLGGAGGGAAGGRVGLLFIDFLAERPTRIRVNGVASVDLDDPLVAEWPGAQRRRGRRRSERAGGLTTPCRRTAGGRNTEGPPEWALGAFAAARG